MIDKHWGIRPDKGFAMQMARRQLAELVLDSVRLEGVNFTLPEIQTLLEGVTVGGRKVSDQAMALNQAAAWRLLFSLVESGQFALTKPCACALHAVAAKEDALAWGQFRDRPVFIAGTTYEPPPADRLDAEWERMVAQTDKMDDPYDRAIHVFLSMARAQFFFDVNKRVGRLTMNGMLLSEGYPAINVPARRRRGFNSGMLDFYKTGRQAGMNAFLRSCLDARVIRAMGGNPNPGKTLRPN